MYRRYQGNITQRRNPRPSSSVWRGWKIEGMSTLLTLSVCSLLTLSLYLSSLAIGPEAWVSFRAVPEAAPPMSIQSPPFQLSGVQLGMTPLEARTVQPGIILTGGRRGEQMGRFRLGNGKYTVSFLADHAARQAFRIHYAEEFWNFAEVEIRHRLIKKFGVPEINTCGMENPMAGWLCRLQWRYSDDVTVDATIRSAPGIHGVRPTNLELIGLNQKLENRKNWRVDGPKKTGFIKRMRMISSGAKGM